MKSNFFIDREEEENEKLFLEYVEKHDEFLYMKYLDWDTRFFCKKSYILDMDKSKFIPNKTLITSLISDFTNSFISVKLETNYNHKYSNLFQKCGFEYIDTEVELTLKSRDDYQFNDNVEIEKLELNIDLPYEELGSSFNLTRFHTDLNIKNDKADLLWIEYLKNFTPTENKCMYIAKIKKKIVGVILVNIFDKIANIFYIAVLDTFRGSGVGRELIQKVIKDFDGFEVKTETQIKNIKALNFYIQNGFMIEKTNSVFHRWS